MKAFNLFKVDPKSKYTLSGGNTVHADNLKIRDGAYIFTIGPEYDTIVACYPVRHYVVVKKD